MGVFAALVCGFAAKRVRLPIIVGYVIGGLLVGPSTPGFTADEHAALQLGEFGVIFMMFGVGLHFSLRDLASVESRRRSGRAAADGSVDRTRLARRLPVVGLVHAGRARPGSCDVDRQHGGTASRSGRPRHVEHPGRQDGSRLAGPRRPGHGGDPGVAARRRRRCRLRFGVRFRRRRVGTRQGGRFHRPGPRRGGAGVPLGPHPDRSHPVTRVVPLGRIFPRREYGLRGLRAVRCVLCARGVPGWCRDGGYDRSPSDRS